MNFLQKGVLAISLLAAASTVSATTYEQSVGDLTTAGFDYDLSNFAVGDILNLTFNLSESADLVYGINNVTTTNGTKGSYVFSLIADDTYTSSGNALTGGTVIQNALDAGSYLLTYVIKSTRFPDLKQSGTISLSSTVAPVPEPETYALMGVGLLGLLAARRRKAMAS